MEAHEGCRSADSFDTWYFASNISDVILSITLEIKRVILIVISRSSRESMLDLQSYYLNESKCKYNLN